ncbi:CASP8 and FADD-like apoptosis regulator a [Engraulis encrasicolus]|uniref:CASP8 and FADD-like apoptosis regulator a n=1 Tax=Engraulis encrasicolus TaxID=184585 RepID=UPI002FD754DD
MGDGLAGTVNRIADRLSRDELRTLRFLCADLLPDSCVEDLRGALISLAEARGNSPSTRMILMELMFHLKRFDILKTVLGTNRQEVEAMLKSCQFLSGYRVLMANLSDDVGTDDLHSLVFLLHGKLSRGKLDRDTSFLDVVEELEKLDEVSSENLEIIEQAFKRIHRVDLVKKIQSFQRKDIPRKHVQHTSEPLRGVCSRPNASPGSSVSQIGLTQAHQPSLVSRPLKLSVPETGIHNQQASEEYRMESNPRGVCVIIDCIGSQGDLLKETFERLGFRVTLHTLLCLEDARRVLVEASQSRDLHGSLAFICCLLSRGSDGYILATESHGPGLSLDAVRQLFDSLSCPALRGRPKLFFIQIYNVQQQQTQGPSLWCSSQTYGHLETDGGGPSSSSSGACWQTDAVPTIPVSADALSCVCVSDAGLLERRGHQSVYWEALSSTLLRCRGRRVPLLDALTEVNRLVLDHSQTTRPHESYHISLSHTLRRTLYL